MPALFALGQHDALVAIQARLSSEERLSAFLDDIYVEPVPNSHGHGAHCNAGRIVGPQWHPNPPWQNPVVEQGWHCSCWKRRFVSCSKGGRPGCHRVEETQKTKASLFWGPFWDMRNLCETIWPRSRSMISWLRRYCSSRISRACGSPPLLRCNASQLCFARGAPRFEHNIRKAPLVVSPPQPHVLGSWSRDSTAL